MKITVLFKSILIISIFSLNFAVASESTPENLLKKYYDALKNPVSMVLDSFWVSDDIARSNNLGIKFKGISAKIDCASPLVFSASFIKDNSCRENIRVEPIDSISAKGFIDIICPGGDSLTTPYYMVKKNNRWRLCSSLYLYANGWNGIETKYYRIFFTDSSLINDYAIKALDSFTDSLMRIFNIASERARYLEEHMIEYYLCSQSEMVLITGYDAHGMTSFPFDAIITRHLPHPHEVTHLIINYVLEEAPLFTLPILQEGIACCLGGRWGKSREVINYWGAAVENLDLVLLDSVLTQKGFNACAVGLDAAYAIGSLLTETLLKRSGTDKFIELYEALSGDQMYVSSLTANQIKTRIESIYGLSWAEIVDKYESTAGQRLNCGIAIGHLANDSTRQIYLNSSLGKAVIIPDSSYYNFEITPTNSGTKGIILFSDDNLHVNDNYRSWQLEEHNTDIGQNNIRYGLCFDTGEVGFYDYLTNTLLAKYVYGFTPLDCFHDDTTGKISFSLERNLLEKEISNYKLSVRLRK